MSTDTTPSLAEARRAATCAAARVQLVDQLRRDATAHEAGRYAEVGQRFDSIGRAVPRGTDPELVKIRIAVAFWSGWTDARDRGWRPDGGIDKADWPLLARTVAADLADDRDVTDPRLIPHFDAERGWSIGNRVQTLVGRIRAG